MRLSCSTRCIPDYSFHQALKAISEAGFRYLETFTHDTGAALDPAIVHTVRIKETFAHYRLALSSLNVTPIAPTEAPVEGAEADLDLRREVVLARDLWLDVINVTTGAPQRCSRGAVVAVLKQLADYAVGLGVSLAIANASGTHVVTADDAERLLDEIGRPNTGILLDLVRFHLAGEDVEAVIDRLASRTLLVRTGDVAQGRSVAVGTGEIDNEHLLQRLAEAGYAGFIVLELQIAARAEVEGLIARAREFIEPLIREEPIAPLIAPRAPTREVDSG